MIFSLAACGGDTSLWQSNETFGDVAVYKYGDVVHAEFASECNVKIIDNNYKHFAKYVEELKSRGFEYIPNGDIPENYNLIDGTAQWRCSNGKVHLQLIFNEDGTSGYDMFDCNVQIYGYSVMPESWTSAAKGDDKSDKTDKEDKTEKNTESASESNTETKTETEQ